MREVARGYEGGLRLVFSKKAHPPLQDICLRGTPRTCFSLRTKPFMRLYNGKISNSEQNLQILGYLSGLKKYRCKIIGKRYQCCRVK